MIARLRMLACAAAAALALFAWAGAAGAADVVVQVSHNHLDPVEVTVAPGTTVEFHNQVEMPGGHTIVADDGSFSSPPLAKDQTWSHTFDKAGMYHYHIQQHPTAKGVVIVK
jgi:plastocyanin